MRQATSLRFCKLGGHARNEQVQVPAVAFVAVVRKVSKGAKLVLAIDYGTQ